jgi:hypothetical protein
MEMKGMLTGAEFTKLENSIDAEFDQLFVKWRQLFRRFQIQLNSSQFMLNLLNIDFISIFIVFNQFSFNSI